LALDAGPRQHVRSGVAVHDFRKLLDGLTLLLGQRLRNFDPHPVANVTAPSPGQLLWTFSSQALNAPVSRAGGDANLLRPVQGGHLDGGAPHRLRDRDRHLDLQVVALAVEHGRSCDVGYDVVIPGRPAGDPRLALAGAPAAA